MPAHSPSGTCPRRRSLPARPAVDVSPAAALCPACRSRVLPNWDACKFCGESLHDVAGSWQPESDPAAPPAATDAPGPALPAAPGTAYDPLPALPGGPDAVYDGLEHQLSDLLPGRAKLGGRPMRAWRCGTEFRWGDAKGRLKNEDPSRGFRHQNK